MYTELLSPQAKTHIPSISDTCAHASSNGKVPVLPSRRTKAMRIAVTTTPPTIPVPAAAATFVHCTPSLEVLAHNVVPLWGAHSGFFSGCGLSPHSVLHCF